MLIHPAYDLSYIYTLKDPDVQRANEMHEKNAQAILDKAKEVFMEAGVSIETRLIYEHDPFSYIRKMVKEKKVDLVILGSKGSHSMFEEILLGSIADKVVRHIPCDILIIR